MDRTFQFITVRNHDVKNYLLYTYVSAKFNTVFFNTSSTWLTQPHLSLVCWEKFYITVNKFQQVQWKHNYTRTQRFAWKPFLFEGKNHGTNSKYFTLLNRDYNTQSYNLSKKKLFFLFTHYSLSLCISHNFFLLSLFFSSLLLAHSLTQFFKTALRPQFLWDFTSCSLAEWPLLLFLHLFLLFFLSHS